MSSLAPRSILVKAPNWIGDQILSYPFFYYLRRMHPVARITVACVSWVESIQFRNLVNDVYVMPRSPDKKLTSRIETLELAAKELRKQGEWDLGISLPNSFSAAWLLYRAGAKRRIGYRGDGRRFLLNDSRDWKKASALHRSEAYVGLLNTKDVLNGKLLVKDFFGIPPEDENDPGDTGVPGVQKEFNAASAWPQGAPLSGDTGVVEPPEGPYWVLAPGSAAESRRWPTEYFAALARQVVAETGMKGLVVGGSSESTIALDLCEDRKPKLQDWTAQGSVSSYWKLFKNAAFTVSNDSGLAHVASLCGSPVQIIWGAGDPRRTEPIGPGKVRVIFNPIECWPCEKNVCLRASGERLECLKGISPETVWKEIKSGLRPKL
jgi:heptosyltransferase-2